jgi:recombination protein RecA
VNLANTSGSKTAVTEKRDTKVMPEIKTLDELMKSGALIKGDDPSLEVIKLPLGIVSLDELLGGGLPLGRCIQFVGPESTGKTLLAQIATAVVQKSQHPLALYMDLERSYDEAWWQQSGVDTQKLLVSTPTTAEEAIDVMRGVLCSTEELGIIVLDSIAAMIPAPEMDPERSSTENRQPGLQAKVVTFMFHQILPLLKGRVIFLVTNQMRDNVGGHDELGALPGGKATRHYSHVILKTRRESWITDNKTKARLGFYMEVTSRKNKLAKTADGDSITLPFMFNSQIDWTTSYIEDAVKAHLIVKAGPYYKVAGRSFLGMQNMREFFTDNPEELEQLRLSLAQL